MKLIGSKVEAEYRKQLIRSRKSLFEDKEKRIVLASLRVRYPKMKTAYTLNWIPEQGEDIYCILVDTDLIVSVEVDRMNKDSEPLIKDTSLEQYQRKLSKTGRIKLAVAVDLAQSEKVA
jgi:hypothetical protein